MRKITVEPMQVDACAMRMEEKNTSYLRNVNELFSAVDAMNVAWKGKDNQAFITKITALQSDFKQVSILCSEYIEFLRNSARSYRNTQEEIASQAQMLGM
ncbi:MAG: WXG100 family type VII secretion target [Erysipelotrichaceae bacterium]|nr:WXG100 family type VII secretion target [Erysipelotrichaceae bacterium]MDY6035480.1 WXG100 family type VII secretion target [Bulleidia sp.]